MPSPLKFTEFGTRSANLAGTALDNVANDARSGTITWTNTTRYPYANITVVLGSLFPGANSGIGLIRRGTDGTATASFTAPRWWEALNNVSGVATVVFERVEVMPNVTNTFLVLNNSNTTFAASGNEFFVTPITEEI